jgi:hypothetical protein
MRYFKILCGEVFLRAELSGKRKKRILAEKNKKAEK